jgi:hypothetical protein
MRAQPLFASRRLSWSRWLVLALMTLCLPLQGALAVTMQMGMAMPSAHVIQGEQGQNRSHAATSPGHAEAMPCHNGNADGMQLGMRPEVRHDVRHGLGSARHEALQVDMPQVHGLKALKHDSHLSTVSTAQTHSPQAHHPELHPELHAASSAASSDSATDAHHGCSFCAQCCIGSALLATPLTVAATPLADAPDAAVPTALLERQPATPDRPPKLRLA